MWRFTGRPVGAHALPLTTEGRIVLVRLTYAPGWRLPGGGLKRGETPEQGVLRELKEEIGLTHHDRIEAVPEQGGALGTVFIARGVRYQPRRSLEVEEVREFDPSSLPADLTARSRRWIQHLLPSGA